MPAIDLKNCTIVIRDGTSPTPNEIELNIGSGNLTWTEHKNREYQKNRGLLDTVRNADEEPVDLSFACKWDFLRASSGNPTPRDAFNQEGQASSWVTSDAADACAPYAVDVILTFAPGCGLDTEVISFLKFRADNCAYDPKAYSIAVTGKCNITKPDVERV